MRKAVARPDIDRDGLLERLDRAAQKYHGNRFARFRRHPVFTVVNSLVGRVFNQLLRGKVVMRLTMKPFFGERIRLSVPPYQEIFMTGAYAMHDPEVRLTKFFIRNLRAGDIFFDLGAHYGYYSLLAHALIGSTGKIVAFEPSPLVLPYLRENAAGKSNFALVEKAVSDRDGHAELHESDVQYSVISTLNPANLRDIPHLGEIKRKVTVETVTLDAFCDLHKIAPDFIKMDIEGSEEKALRGATELLRRSSPAVALEIFLDTVSPNYKNAIGILRESGFEMCAISDDGSIYRIQGAELERYTETLKEKYSQQGTRSTTDNLIFIKPRHRASHAPRAYVTQRPAPISCPVCLEKPLGEFRFMRDYQSGEQTFTLYGCPACAAQFWMPFRGPGPEWYRNNVENKAREQVAVRGLATPRSYWNTGYFLKNAGKIEKELPNVKRGDLRILDIGCGTSEVLRELDKMGYAVAGVDFDPEEIEIGKKEFGLKNLFADDIFHFLENCRDMFHIITCFEVVEHVDKPLELLRLIRSKLVPGGILVLSAPNRERHWGRTAEATDFPPHHLVRHSDTSLRAILARAGFENIRLKKELPVEFFASKLRFGLFSYFQARHHTSNAPDGTRPDSRVFRPPAYLVKLALLKNRVVQIFFFLPALILFSAFKFRGTTILAIAKKRE